MKITLDIPDHSGNGIHLIWDPGSKYAIKVDDYKGVVVLANKNALVSMAKQMLYLAYNDLPKGSHVHYDSFFTKIDQEYELIIEKETE